VLHNKPKTIAMSSVLEFVFL